MPPVVLKVNISGEEVLDFYGSVLRVFTKGLKILVVMSIIHFI